MANKEPSDLTGQPISQDLTRTIESRLQTAATLSQDHAKAHEAAGMIRAFQFTEKLLTVSTLKILAEIKESKAYVGMSVLDAQGKLLTVSKWEEYCESIGLSRATVDANLLNLSELGESFLQSATKLGLGYRDLRKLRKLPEDIRTVVYDQVEIDVGDPESIKELIDDLTSRHAAKQRELEATIEAKQTTIERKNQIIDDKTREIDQLNERVSKKPKQLKPDEKLASLRLDLSNAGLEATAAVKIRMQKCISDLLDHDNHQREYVAGIVAEVVSEARYLQTLFALNENPTGEQPDWMKAALAPLADESKG